MNKKTYKDLPREEELEFVLWWSFLEDSVKNSYTQIRRWNRQKHGWDLQMFVIVMANIDDTAKCLKRFLYYKENYKNDPELWGILKSFQDKVKKQNLRSLRNDIIHRKELFQQKDSNGKPLPQNPILILGSYDVAKKEYTFGSHKLNISESFALVQDLRKDIRHLFKQRLLESRTKNNYSGMIPYTFLHSFS